MTIDKPWVRGDLPWLRSGPLFRVRTDAWPHLDAYITGKGYRRFELDGRRMTSRQDAHAELARAFAFPEWCGKNWDAFNDCFGDFVEQHDGQLLAIVWRNIDAAATAAPVTTAEVGWALVEARQGYMPTLAEGTTSRVAIDLFVIGDGEDFDAP